DHWLLVQNAKDDPSDELSKVLEETQEMSRAYSRWFLRNFGMGSETGVIGLDQASQVLVGPLPAGAEGRVPFKPLAGAQVRIATEDYVMASSADDYRARHENMVLELAQQMAGGDLASLRP